MIMAVPESSNWVYASVDRCFWVGGIGYKGLEKGHGLPQYTKEETESENKFPSFSQFWKE